MSYPTTRIDTVWHAGTLELEDRTRQDSLEGNLLSVSEHPEEWSHIARCAGQTWALSREGAEWLDVLALSDEALAEIQDWAISEGYAVRGDIWRVWHYDDEADDWAYFEFDNENAAQAQIDPDLDDDEDIGIPSESGGQLDQLEGMLLTPAGQEAVGRWSGTTQAMDPIIMIWADRHLKPDHPDLMGVWWYEEDNPQSLSCPRGGAFTDRLCEFEISDEHGRAPPQSFIDRHWPQEDPSPGP